MAKTRDIYANMLVADLDQSAANTITFQEINIGLNVFDKVGLIVQRLEYDINAADFDALDTVTDFIALALTASNSLTSLSPDERAVIDRVALINNLIGAAANLNTMVIPIIHDFSSLAGGGLLIPPRPLYFGVNSGGMAAALVDLKLRLYFTVLSLDATDYIELFETRRFLT